MPDLTLRRATLTDASSFERWDREPHVIAATTNDSDVEKAFGDHDWRVEILKQSGFDEFLIAEPEGRPIGAMQIIDSHREPTHYWGEIEPDLRAIDIRIGDASNHGKGYSATRLAFRRCCADPAVTAIVIDPLASNARTHDLYKRIRFVPVGRRMFAEDDCLVHRLSRESWLARFPEDYLEPGS